MSHNGVDRPQVAKIAAQIGSSLMPDNDQWVNRFTVNSTSSSSVYTVSQRRSNGVWGCSCPGWRHHRKCKHVTDILRRLANLPAAAQQFEPAVLEMLASARTAYLDLGAPQPVRTPTVLTHRELDLGGAM
jgi:hypothetical protein